MEKTTSSSPLDSVRFIFRHPIIFISSFILVFSAIISYFMYLPAQYQSFAIIDFESSSSGLTDQKFIQRKQDLLKSILIGENIRKIMNAIFPDLSESTDPRKYSLIASRLTNPYLGIRVMPEKNPARLGGQQFVSILFVDKNPQLAYKVVQATIAVLKTVSKETTEEKIESGINFLREQIELYKEKRIAIDEEISKIKSELKSAYPYLTDQQKNLVDDQLKTIVDLDLSVAEDTGARKTERGPATLSYLIAMDVQKDPFVKEYSQAITTKEITLRELKTQGYLPAHPYVVKLQAELSRLKTFRQARITEITGAADASLSRQGNENASGAEYKPDMNAISAQVARLSELKNEKEVNARYYNDMRQQLEVSELKGRLERAEAGIEIRVIQEARVPMQPLPNVQMKSLFLGAFISLIVALGLSYFADSMDDSIKTSSELRYFLQVPVLGSINQMNTKRDVAIRRTRLQLTVVSLVVIVVLLNIVMKLYIVLTTKPGIV